MMQAQRTQTSEINATHSLNLMKNLLRSGLSCIAFMRGMFPAECFKKQKISGITVHTLQPTEAEPRKLMDWIDQGCLPSLEKRYLEELVFAIYGRLDVAGENQFYLIETYNFQIRYHENDVVMTRKAQGVEVSRSVPTKQEISQATVSMIRSLITMGGTMPPLPGDRAFSIKLLYRDDITPEDYQPMHFHPVTSEHQLRFFSKPEAVAIGNIATPYHELNLHVLVPEENQRELATKFAIGGSNDMETYPAYTATINDPISATLSEHITPSLRNADDDMSSAIKGSNTQQISATTTIIEAERQQECQENKNNTPQNTIRTNTLIKAPQNSKTAKSANRNDYQESATSQKEAGESRSPIQRRRKLPFAETSELLKAIQNGVYRKVPGDIYGMSPLAAEKLEQLIELYSCEEFDLMQSLYLQLEVLLFLSESAPVRSLATHFRGTKLTRTLIRDHLNRLVESGLATRKSTNLQVVSLEDAFQHSQIQKIPVDDEAETMETGGDRAIKSIGNQVKQSIQQSAIENLSLRLQRHIESGAVTFTQSDIEEMQTSRPCLKSCTKRKISTSEDIYQTSNKRAR